MTNLADLSPGHDLDDAAIREALGVAGLDHAPVAQQLEFLERQAYLKRRPMGHATPKPTKRERVREASMKRTPIGATRRASDNAEQRFQYQVEAFATLKGWWHFHVVNPRTQTAGLPDLVLIRDRLVFMELKATSLLTGRTGKLRPAQERVIDMLKAAGQEVYVLTDSSDDWVEVQRILA